jgi:cbb3-type cytochrome oxidase subunit 3
MSFNTDHIPNLVSDQVISEIHQDQLLTISEKVIKFVKELMFTYIWPHLFVIIIFIGVVAFLAYRYKMKKARDVMKNNNFI